MPEHEGDRSPREDVPSPPEEPGSSQPSASRSNEVLFGSQCACRLGRVRRDIERAIRVLSQTEERLCLDEQLALVRLTTTEAERLDRFCLNLKVAIDEQQRWARLLASAVESLVGRGPKFDA
jgi:hypothetical protein